MRTLVILRGPQGAGKSTWLRDNQLEPFSLSMDNLRLLLRGPVLTGDGLGIDQQTTPAMLKLLHQLLDERMAQGEFLIVDGTHQLESDFARYQELAKTHRYQLICVDFYAGVTPDICKERNRSRDPIRQVPETVIDRAFERNESFNLPAGIARLSPLEFASAILKPRIHDFTEYRRVVHIGDIQGCMDPLNRVFEDGIDPDTAYIFTGDYLDRGLQNAEVMAFMLSIYREPNVFCLWGNHEDHLHRYAVGLPSVSSVFSGQTLPELKRAGIEREQIDAFCDSLMDLLQYRHGRHQVQVTHGGLSLVAKRPVLLPAAQARKGTGYYSTPVDSEFDANAPEGWYQVHGHRNLDALGVQASRRSFNLEGAVEFGGSLRVVTLTDAGFEPSTYPNRTYRPARERRHRDHDVVPRWIRDEPMPGTHLREEDLQALINHPDINRKDRGSVSSFNFSRKAFFARRFDELSIKARGLFIDAESSEIIARGYDKFFGWGEPNVPGVDPETLETSLVFPVKAYTKENGFLGLVGVTPDGELFYASKSTPDSEHAGWLKDQMRALLTEGQCTVLARWLRDYEACLAFEVIEPVNDPHIIAYDRPKLVLLDVIRRSLTFERLPYADLKAFGSRFGFDVKAQHSLHPDWRSLSGFVRGVQTGGVRAKEGEVEGFVIEDAMGRCIKVKSAFYDLWKEARNVRNHLARCHQRGEPFERCLRPLKGLAPFVSWLRAQPPEAFSTDIIRLREAYEEECLASRKRKTPSNEPAL